MLATEAGQSIVGIMANGSVVHGLFSQVASSTLDPMQNAAPNEQLKQGLVPQGRCATDTSDAISAAISSHVGTACQRLTVVTLTPSINNTSVVNSVMQDQEAASTTNALARPP